MPTTGRPFPCPLKYVLKCKSTYTDITLNPLVYSRHQNGYYLQVPDFAFPFFVFRAQKHQPSPALSLWYSEKGSLVYTQTLCPFTWPGHTLHHSSYYYLFYDWINIYILKVNDISWTQHFGALHSEGRPSTCSPLAPTSTVTHSGRWWCIGASQLKRTDYRETVV